MKLLLDIKNNIDFFLRRYLKFSRKNYNEKNEEKEGLFAKQKARDKEQGLCDKYDLSYLKLNSTRQNYKENLYTLDLLDRYLEINPKDNLNVLDIGCKNWFYAKGEYFFFKNYCKNLTLDGIEIDANRLYSNFYSRGQVAQFYIKDLKGANFYEGDFLKHENKYDYIIWILPFVAQAPHLNWGLPKKYFQPEKMLKKAYDSLNVGGKIFIVNQGENEYKKQKELCDKFGFSYQDKGEVKSEFLEYKHSRFVIVISKLN